MSSFLNGRLVYHYSTKPPLTMSRRRGDSCYPYPKRGHCVIVNNSEFNGMPNEERRNDPAKDGDDLRTLFERLNFLVDIRQNLTAHEMEELLDEYSQMIHSYSCFFVVILSHGRKRHEVLSSDNEVMHTNQIIAKFSEKQCPSLADKPKVFLIQTCRGKHPPYYSKDLDSQELASLPKNTLLVHSMMEGSLPVSNFHGLWYIREFIKTVEEDGEREHLVDMLTIVNSVISESMAIGFVQKPEMINNLSKKFYLKPQVSTPVIVQDIDLVDTPYSVNQLPRGYCIIINNRGSACQDDATSLSEIMKESLGFHVELFNDLSILAISCLLRNVSRAADCAEVDALFVAIFATGNDKYFKESDKKVMSFDETVAIFNTVTDKPKIFLFHIAEEEGFNLLDRVTDNVDRVPLIRRARAATVSTGSSLKASGGSLLKRAKDKVPFARSDSDSSMTDSSEASLFKRVRNKVPFVRSDSDSATPDSPEGSLLKRVTERVPFVHRDNDIVLPPVYCNREDVFQVTFTHPPSPCPTFVSQLVTSLRQCASTTSVNEILHNACQYGGDGCSATFHCPVRELHLPLVDLQPSDVAIAFTAREFKMALNVWLPMRKRTIVELHKKKEELIKLGRNVRIAKVAGASASIAGGAATIFGLALTPVTLGGSLLVAGVGAGVAAVGGATAVGATIADVAITKRTLKDAGEILDVDSQLCQIAGELFARLREQASEISSNSNDPSITPEDVIVAFLRGGANVLKVGVVAAVGGVAAAEIISVGGVGAIEGGILAARIGGVALTGVAVVGGVLTLAVLPINIYDLSTNAYKLSKKSPTKAVEAIERQLDELEKQRRKLEKILAALKEQ